MLGDIKETFLDFEESDILNDDDDAWDLNDEW